MQQDYLTNNELNNYAAILTGCITGLACPSIPYRLQNGQETAQNGQETAKKNLTLV